MYRSIIAKDYPDAVDRLVVMDNVPTRIVARDAQRNYRQGLLVLLIPSRAGPAGGAHRRPRGAVAAALLFGLVLQPVYYLGQEIQSRRRFLQNPLRFLRS